MTALEMKHKDESNYTPLQDFPLSQQYCKEPQTNSGLASNKLGKLAVATILALTLVIAIYG
ncbi:hypothetical protein RI845_10490 [Thalassotalea nanhaiensis]|uniref:Uncharacterized protein n=1 Tax=Thalassotalea nanhaiensis TaxID=3065648 RepID=A0ABY9TFC5_9GAMM|nr:hypothetical protein RI845_10490 [Colwelliaceae bacterium SQ345]